MTTHEPTTPAVERRTVLRLLGGAAISGTALATSSKAVTAQSSESDLDSWFDDTSNYDGVVDETGAETVTVTVGANANGGAFGFGPAAVRVDPGTTVVWRWTGDGGIHDVTAEDGSFASDLVGEADHTFEHTFDTDGVSRYHCSPHVGLGMKGAVVVGGGETNGASEATSATTDASADLDSWFERTSNYDGVVDQTGLARVSIDVGADANGGAFGFGPAALRVSKGTTVVWTWTGDGGAHDVTAEDGTFESELASDGGHTFEHTFDEAGTSRYACTPHETLGMRGAVVVTDEAGGSHAEIAEPFDDPEMERLGGLGLAGTFGAAMASPALFGALQWWRGDESDESSSSR